MGFVASTSACGALESEYEGNALESLGVILSSSVHDRVLGKRQDGHRRKMDGSPRNCVYWTETPCIDPAGNCALLQLEDERLDHSHGHLPSVAH